VTSACRPARDRLRRFDADAGDDQDETKVRTPTTEQVETLLRVIDPRWRLLAATGLRISEALALRWRDLRLDGDQAAVIVRRAYVKGVYGPPKSRHGAREITTGFERHGRNGGEHARVDACGRPISADATAPA
jgi:integrase